MISLIIPPRDQIARINRLLAEEFGTASNIKNRVNRLSVLGAIVSVQARLKLYTRGASRRRGRHCVPPAESGSCARVRAPCRGR